jgi:hypothetical protein
VSSAGSCKTRYRLSKFNTPVSRTARSWNNSGRSRSETIASATSSNERYR